VQQPGIMTFLPQRGRWVERALAVTLGTLAILICSASSALTPAQSHPNASLTHGAASFTTFDVHGFWTHLKLPADAVNLASRSAGASASASSTAAKFDPAGAIDGNWTVQGWGKGHGWQNAKRHEYPSWLEVRLPREEEIDSIVVSTFPEVARGVNWMGIRNADIDVRIKGQWFKVGGRATTRANLKGIIFLQTPPLRIDAVRINIVGANTGSQEDIYYDDDDFARILQVGVYRLRTPYPFSDEDVSAHVERGPRGSVAIYRDDLPVKPHNPSSPEYLASMFRKAGYGVTFLDSKAVMVPEILNPRNFDVFVQPYGAPFPVESALYQFLAGGGHLVTLGGHPFKQALMFTPEGKLVDAGYDAGITTTATRQSDYKLPFRQQLGMFYTGFERFEDVAYVQPAPGQQIVKSQFKTSAHLEGEVAAGYVGERLSMEDAEQLVREGTFPEYAQRARRSLANLVSVLNASPDEGGMDYLSGYVFNWPRARWIPLVNAYDRVGRLRGAVISMIANFRGPYRGSSWIFCGVENQDLFTAEHPEFIGALLDVVRSLNPGMGLHDALPEMDCYYQGETARVAVTVENYLTKPRQVSVNFQFVPTGGKAPAFEKRIAVDVPAGGKVRPSLDWKPAHFDSDLYTIRVTLWEGDRQIDAAESAFVVWDPKIIAQGPKVDFHDSYFHVGGRPQLLIGNRTMGFQPHGQVDEDVLSIDRQYAQMHEYGMKVFSPVFFSFYIPGLAWGDPQTPAVPPQLQRQIDAQAQLAQKHHLIFAPCLFFIAKRMAMAHPEFSRRICEEMGKRYANVPGMIFYIFDDGTLTTPLKDFEDWTRQCTEGFAASGRKYVVMAETGGMRQERYGSQALTMPANGNYHPGRPAFYRGMDMRMAGKSFHLSEFGVNSPGAQPSDIDLHTYPGYNVSGSPAGDYSLYLMEPHLLFATGGSYLVNWVWKDTAHLLFPWGINHANDYTPTKPMISYRNESFFLRRFQPEFIPPKVLVVFPQARLERDEETYAAYLHGVMNVLLEAGVQFAAIDDGDLDRIPAGPHVLIYPDPHYASPEVLAKLRTRVEAGDDLFLSGDFSQPLETGGPRATDLFSDLAGLKWVGDYPEGSEIPLAPSDASGLLNPYIGHPLSMFQPAGARVLAVDSAGNAVIAAQNVGSGQVFFTSDAGLDGAGRALNAFFALGHVPSTEMFPKRANRDILEIDRIGGGKIYTLAATRPDIPSATFNGPWIEHPESYVVNTGNQRIDLPLGAYGISLFAVRGDGAVDAVEGQGIFRAGGKELFSAEQHAMAVSLDDAALVNSHTVGLFVLGGGKISIALSADVDTVETGETMGGQFHPLEEVRTTREDGRLTFELDDVQARGVVLITSKAEREHARQLMSAAIE